MPNDVSMNLQALLGGIVQGGIAKRRRQEAMAQQEIENQLKLSAILAQQKPVKVEGPPAGWTEAVQQVQKTEGWADLEAGQKVSRYIEALAPQFSGTPYFKNLISAMPSPEKSKTEAGYTLAPGAKKPRRNAEVVFPKK